MSSTSDSTYNSYFEKIVSDLVELKDTSELMMDLAYSSILLNSKELSEEVMRLEEKVDIMHTNFDIYVLSSCIRTESAEGFLGLIRMGDMMERIADAAKEIAEIVLRGIEPHPVLKMVIESADETVARVIVSEKSTIVGKTLAEARIPEETGMWILSIRRGDRWLRPHGRSMIEAGDVVLASGYAEGEEDFKRLVSGQATPPKMKRKNQRKK